MTKHLHPKDQNTHQIYTWNIIIFAIVQKMFAKLGGYHWSKFNLNTVCGRKNIDRFWILQTILWIVQWWHNKGDIIYYRAFSRAITGYCFNVTTLAEFEILIDLAFYRLVCKLYRSHMTKEIKSTIVIFCKGLLLLQGSTLWRL